MDFTGSSLPGLKDSSRLAFVLLLDLTYGDNLLLFLVVDTAQDEDWLLPGLRYFFNENWPVF